MPALLVAELDARLLKSRYKTIDDLDVLTGWTASGAGTQALDIVNFRQGIAGIKQTTTAGSNTVQSAKSFGPIDLQGVGLSDHIRFWFYINNIARFANINVEFIDNQGSPVTANSVFTTGAVQGWNRFSVPKSAFTNGGTVRWSTIATVRLNTTSSAAGSLEVTWDMLRLMLGPTIGYTGGVWDESHAIADVIDGKVKFFDNGYWQLNDVRIKPTDFYRVKR